MNNELYTIVNVYLSNYPLTKTSILKFHNLHAQYNNKYECRIHDSIDQVYKLKFELSKETQGLYELLYFFIFYYHFLYSS